MKTYLPLILVAFLLISNNANAQEKQPFKPGKFKRHVELDMAYILRGYIGTNLIYRKKYENKNSQLVFADRLPYWRFGLYLNGYSRNYSFDATTNQTVLAVMPKGEANIYIAPFIGRETMFYWGRFNVFYAIDFGVNYQYISDNSNSKTPCIANAFGLSTSFSGGLRYYISDRFSVGVQSTPISLGGNYKFGKFYPGLGQNWGVPNVKFSSFNFSINQNWLSMLGFAYHF